MEFQPERFLLENGQLNPEIRDPDEVFGFGRRVCIGQHVANDALFAAFSVLLWVFQFSKPLDKEGLEVYLDADDIVVTGFYHVRVSRSPPVSKQLTLLQRTSAP